MRYHLRHVTRYTYGSPVDLAAHMLHLLPRTLPGQQVLADTLISEPAPGRRGDRLDHFGNRVTWLFLETSHERFEIVAESDIEVAFAPPPPADRTLAWEEVARLAREPEAWREAEFVFDSPLVPALQEARTFAASSFPPGRPVLEALLELNTRIKREFTYKSGVTHVGTSVGEVMQKRVGVCQDFSHVMISALRAMGLPVRYVSGYVCTRPPPGQARRQGADQSHAWVGCWLGPDHGWVDLDPTNALVVSDEHVVLGWGRDYGDVSPIRGVILGGGHHSQVVNVDLIPEDEDPP